MTFAFSWSRDLHSPSTASSSPSLLQLPHDVLQEILEWLPLGANLRNVQLTCWHLFGAVDDAMPTRANLESLTLHRVRAFQHFRPVAAVAAAPLCGWGFHAERAARLAMSCSELASILRAETVMLSGRSVGAEHINAVRQVEAAAAAGKMLLDVYESVVSESRSICNAVTDFSYRGAPTMRTTVFLAECCLRFIAPGACERVAAGVPKATPHRSDVVGAEIWKVFAAWLRAPRDLAEAYSLPDVVSATLATAKVASTGLPWLSLFDAAAAPTLRPEDFAVIEALIFAEHKERAEDSSSSSLAEWAATLVRLMELPPAYTTRRTYTPKFDHILALWVLGQYHKGLTRFGRAALAVRTVSEPLVEASKLERRVKGFATIVTSMFIKQWREAIVGEESEARRELVIGAFTWVR